METIANTASIKGTLLFIFLSFFKSIQMTKKAKAFSRCTHLPTTPASQLPEDYLAGRGSIPLPLHDGMPSIAEQADTALRGRSPGSATQVRHLHQIRPRLPPLPQAFSSLPAPWLREI